MKRLRTYFAGGCQMKYVLVPLVTLIVGRIGDVGIIRDVVTYVAKIEKGGS